MSACNEYQTLIAQINKLTERRQSVSSIYLSVNAAIMTAIAFWVKNSPMMGWKQQASLLLLLVAGIVASDLWRRLIMQYSTLLDWWYKQIRNVEETLQESNKIFSREYQELYSGEHRKIPIGLTRYEIRLTWLFTILYVIFAFSIICLLLFG